MAWDYGSLDGLQQGRAFGSPLGIDYATPCVGDDLTDAVDVMNCAIEQGIVSAPNGSCGKISTLYASEKSNVNFTVAAGFISGDSIASYTFSVLNPQQSAQATFDFVGTNGVRQTRGTVVCRFGANHCMPAMGTHCIHGPVFILIV